MDASIGCQVRRERRHHLHGGLDGLRSGSARGRRGPDGPGPDLQTL